VGLTSHGFEYVIVSVVACCQASSSPASARKMGTASIVFSVLSLVIVLILVVVGLISVFVFHLYFVDELILMATKEFTVSNLSI